MRFLPVVAFSAFVLVAAVARAETMDTITFSFPGEAIPPYAGGPPSQIQGVNFSATLPANPQPVAPPFGPNSGPGFWYNTDGLPFYQQPQGAPGTSFDFSPGAVSFVATEDVNFPRAYDYFSIANGSSLYTGPDDAPMLVPGVYNADYVFSLFGTYDLPGTITIAPVSSESSPVPEPSSLTLAASGALAMLGVWRTRRQAA